MDQNTTQPQPTMQPAPEQAAVTQPSPMPTPPPAMTPTPVKKNNMMLFVVIGIVVLLAAGVGVFMVGSMNKSASKTAAMATQVTQPTVTPVVTTGPQTPVDEVNSVNVTVDNSDMKDVQKDVNSL